MNSLSLSKSCSFLFTTRRYVSVLKHFSWSIRNLPRVFRRRIYQMNASLPVNGKLTKKANFIQKPGSNHEKANNSKR